MKKPPRDSRNPLTKASPEEEYPRLNRDAATDPGAEGIGSEIHVREVDPYRKPDWSPAVTPELPPSDETPEREDSDRV